MAPSVVSLPRAKSHISQTKGHPTQELICRAEGSRSPKLRWTNPDWRSLGRCDSSTWPAHLCSGPTKDTAGQSRGMRLCTVGLTGALGQHEWPDWWVCCAYKMAWLMSTLWPHGRAFCLQNVLQLCGVTWQQAWNFILECVRNVNKWVIWVKGKRTSKYHFCNFYVNVKLF